MKFMNLKRFVVPAALATVAGSAFADATGPDMSALTGAISFGTVTVAILSVAGLLAVVYTAVKGAKMALSMIKGG